MVPWLGELNSLRGLNSLLLGGAGNQTVWINGPLNGTENYAASLRQTLHFNPTKYSNFMNVSIL